MKLVPLLALLLTLMLLGWGILAVPTGIVTAEMTTRGLAGVSGRTCGACATAGHAADARYCRRCGAAL